jgi:hypothetical protein
MKIEKLLNLFKKLLILYKEAYNKKYDYFTLYKNGMNQGLCNCSYKNYNIDIYSLFSKEGYYKNYVDNHCTLINMPLVCKAIFYNQKSIHKKCILPRIEFLKKEIKSLQKLLDKGYTHI